MEEKLLEVRHLKKYFHTPAGLLHAVDDVDFSIPKGKTMGVVESPAAENPRWDGLFSAWNLPQPGRSFLREKILRLFPSGK